MNRTECYAKIKEMKVRAKCYEMIKKQIKADLTQGMRDNDKKPWKKVDIQKYIESREKDIQKVLDVIEEDAASEPEEWNVPLMDWIREYLHEDLKGYTEFIGKQWDRDEGVYTEIHGVGYTEIHRVVS
jgi:hypothetical protein